MIIMGVGAEGSIEVIIDSAHVPEGSANDANQISFPYLIRIVIF